MTNEKFLNFSIRETTGRTFEIPFSELEKLININNTTEENLAFTVFQNIDIDSLSEFEISNNTFDIDLIDSHIS